MEKCRSNKQINFIVYLVITLNTITLAHSEDALIFNSLRRPASYTVNDDIIIVPVEMEETFFSRLNDKYKVTFDNHRKIVENWQINAELEQVYGLEGRRVFQTSTIQQRQNFLQRNYLRFISRQVENNANQGLANWWERWSADDELDSIQHIEKQEIKIKETKKEAGLPVITKQKNANSGKDEINFGFQPVIELGMMRITANSKYFSARAWLGINGDQEIYIEKKFKLTNTRVLYNYYIERNRSLTAIDQGLTRNISLRLTHDKNIQSFGTINASGLSENNIVQLRFGMGF